MLSHLRFHRRGQSNPTSPGGLEQQSSTQLLAGAPPPPPPPLNSHTLSSAESQSSGLKPSLPQIARVTTAGSSMRLDDFSDADIRAMQADYLPVQPQRSTYNAAGSGFIGGVALENYRRGLQAQKGRTTGDNGTTPAQPDPSFRPRPTPVSSIADVPNRAPRQQISSFTSPSELSSSVSGGSSRWSPAANSIPEAAPPTLSTGALPMEPQKGKKGLPFLKNPMSTLLLRRKLNQNAPDILPLPLKQQNNDSTYDPRIKGTRVHDFGAPRTTTTTTTTNRNDVLQQLQTAQNGSIKRYDESSGGYKTAVVANHETGTQSDNRSSSWAPLQPNSSISSNTTKSRSIYGSIDRNHIRLPSYDNEANQESSLTQRDSNRIRRSRNVSQSSIPKHMKSTSSRFSFVVGAASQEAILEEKHRQLEIGKQDAEPAERSDSRFDEFDEEDFDYDAMMNDDGLEERIPGVNADYEDDYDEMGYENQYLEEDVPYANDDDYDQIGSQDAGQFGEEALGLGAETDINPNAAGTYEEQKGMDLKDQTTLAQFIFQSSNPASSMASPQINNGLLPTPRDADGNIIGSALTKDTPTTSNFPIGIGQLPTSSNFPLTQEMAGLGLDEADMHFVGNTSQQYAADPSGLGTVEEDGSQFDSVVEYEDEDEFAEDLAAQPEYDVAPFDESIFDSNDTDQYGRPIPGAFAHAQSSRHQKSTNVLNRESDMTSRLSTASALTKSTAHTSLSADDAALSSQLKQSSVDPVPLAPTGSLRTPQGQNSMAVYQAALAAAAHEAAASGKFQRSTSPVQEDAASESDFDDANVDEDSTIKVQFDDDYTVHESSYEDMDEFEMDDDAIAEANASALANDSDGWYGQEFGFYSSPSAHHSSSYDSSSNYGGFFGPKGMSELARSPSGRLISREPNLTPITERSEYSNRNSIMSMGLPALQSGTPTTLQSPGLAQLAMMAEEGDDQMTLSALLRLRSRAWGGSQASIGSSKEGSPRSERGEVPQVAWTGNPVIGIGSSASGINGPGHVRQSSNYSLASRESDADSSPSSPANMVSSSSTMYGSFQQPLQSGRQPGNPLRGNSAPAAYRSVEHRLAQSTFPSEVDVPGSAPGSATPGRKSSEWTWDQETSASSVPTRRSKGHRRHNSSADSISYIVEEEETGEPRWIMERRRTTESGEVEILEREVVDGGRI